MTELRSILYSIEQNIFFTALRQSSIPTTGDGGRDPETGLFPSPIHAVRNTIGSNKSFTTSSYDIRAENSSDAYAGNNEGYMSPKKSASRPFTAAPVVIKYCTNN